MAGGLEGAAPGVDSGSFVVVIFYGSYRLDVEPRFDGNHTLFVWSRRSRLFSQSDQGAERLAAHRRKDTGASFDVDRGPVGWSVRAAFGCGGDVVCQLAIGIFDFRIIRGGLGVPILPVVPGQSP